MKLILNSTEDIANQYKYEYGPNDSVESDVFNQKDGIIFILFKNIDDKYTYYLEKDINDEVISHYFQKHKNGFVYNFHSYVKNIGSQYVDVSRTANADYNKHFIKFTPTSKLISTETLEFCITDIVDKCIKISQVYINDIIKFVTKSALDVEINDSCYNDTYRKCIVIYIIDRINKAVKEYNNNTNANDLYDSLRYIAIRRDYNGRNTISVNKGCLLPEDLYVESYTARINHYTFHNMYLYYLHKNEYDEIIKKEFHVERIDHDPDFKAYINSVAAANVSVIRSRFTIYPYNSYIEFKILQNDDKKIIFDLNWTLKKNVNFYKEVMKFGVCLKDIIDERDKREAIIIYIIDQVEKELEYIKKKGSNCMKQPKNLCEYHPTGDSSITDKIKKNISEHKSLKYQAMSLTDGPCYTLDTITSCAFGNITLNNKNKRSYDIEALCKFDDLNPIGSVLRAHFTINDVKFSGNRVIVFWTDGTKTIVAMQDDESKYDIDKAIMAAYTKKILSYYPTSKERSMNKMLDKWIEKYKTYEKDIKAQLKKIKERKAKGKDNGSKNNI